MDSKQCKDCGEWKLGDNFYKNKCTRDKLNIYCKECDKQRRYRNQATNPQRKQNTERRSAYKLKYGITVEEYDFMLLKQGGGCAICGVTEHSNGRKLFVDHNHETGAVRGILCQHCNSMLGQAKDNPDNLRKGALYLEASNE